MGKCIQCGMCCRAIILRYSKKDIRNHWGEDSGNKAFVLANWIRISKEQALKNNPNLRSIMKEYKRSKETEYYYACKLQVENRCSIHNDLPSICSGYPWYGKEPTSKEFLYGEHCGYKKDILFQHLKEGASK